MNKILRNNIIAVILVEVLGFLLYFCVLITARLSNILLWEGGVIVIFGLVFGRFVMAYQISKIFLVNLGKIKTNIYSTILVVVFNIVSFIIWVMTSGINILHFPGISFYSTSYLISGLIRGESFELTFIVNWMCIVIEYICILIGIKNSKKQDYIA